MNLIFDGKRQNILTCSNSDLRKLLKGMGYPAQIKVLQIVIIIMFKFMLMHFIKAHKPVIDNLPSNTLQGK